MYYNNFECFQPCSNQQYEHYEHKEKPSCCCFCICVSCNEKPYKEDRYPEMKYGKDSYRDSYNDNYGKPGAAKDFLRDYFQYQ